MILSEVILEGAGQGLYRASSPRRSSAGMGSAPPNNGRGASFWQLISGGGVHLDGALQQFPRSSRRQPQLPSLPHHGPGPRHRQGNSLRLSEPDDYVFKCPLNHSPVVPL